MNITDRMEIIAGAGILASEHDNGPYFDGLADLAAELTGLRTSLARELIMAYANNTSHR